MSEQREMTLDEWMARLPESHAANRELAALRARLAELEAERDRLRGLIDEHNNECVRRCGEGEQEGVRCGYRPYFPRRCPECPRHEMIEVAALDKNDIIDRARVAELTEALENIAIYGCGMLSMPPAANMPERDWLRARIAEYERVAYQALGPKLAF